MSHCLAASNAVLSRYSRSVTTELFSRSTVPHRFPRPPEPRGRAGAPGTGTLPRSSAEGNRGGGGDRGARTPSPNRSSGRGAAGGGPGGVRSVRQPLSPGVGPRRGRSPAGRGGGRARGRPGAAPPGGDREAQEPPCRDRRDCGAACNAGETGGGGEQPAVPRQRGAAQRRDRRSSFPGGTGEAVRDTCGPAPPRPAVCGTAPVPSHRVPGAERCGAVRAQVCSAPSARPPGAEPPGTAPGFPACPVGARGRSGRGGAQPGDPGPVSVLLSGEAAISQ